MFLLVGFLIAGLCCFEKALLPGPQCCCTPWDGSKHMEFPGFHTKIAGMYAGPRKHMKIYSIWRPWSNFAHRSKSIMMLGGFATCCFTGRAWRSGEWKRGAGTVGSERLCAILRRDSQYLPLSWKTQMLGYTTIAHRVHARYIPTCTPNLHRIS